MKIKTLVRAAAAGIGAGLLYRKLLRQAILTWGATAEEAQARLPGDELLEDADGVATRAITIDAPASAVWPWIAQMGPSPRGGAYTYDWIENLLGLNMHSADTILAEYQHQQVGEGFGYGTNKMSFKIVEPEHVLATQSADGKWVWSFILDERDGRTRLISRNRFRLPGLRDKIGMIPMEPGSLVMERKMLYGSNNGQRDSPRNNARALVPKAKKEFTTEDAPLRRGDRDRLVDRAVRHCSAAARLRSVAPLACAPRAGAM